ncbi:hypothetical protein AAFX91_32695 [Bradyrhizobium sp. 31Argb]|uniref:hypothetical protein n=1 Tax=unclassified Bradyrhizobium TaxID=2631580 RepID=UPI0013EE8214|nr:MULTISPECIES: hypothetical protein [unclassified Bradyrhizobium]
MTDIIPAPQTSGGDIRARRASAQRGVNAKRDAPEFEVKEVESKASATAMTRLS